ncbi:hypothetical protein METBIDRAFT_12788 [Metschnikowia bicuspidata var. bicuspidata NRRL YB-4993]|uniref:Protein Zds1 C-terminal domain-containing protein n=1 Tax=Metschnikowia bicuspidata var. bicuspidata NRRL YB-4993 TaxID=869754 RepID=A0A1A0H706_9ASCO|nr:hypothetical protein METBIDRAFT_12788 [Metschnikowia bicuspidata var. bicuspidata NRRL YB-4993]OBA19740.1 hypothetical protein METBIDRAFT_12788 [Metschnikowia bicuspidata var. bicuspidata NRRL YB-4993]
MPPTRLRSLSTSPAKNTPENYQLAARQIEQEKQMVAALKRLLFGALMNLDPDIPALDASLLFLVDRQLASGSQNGPPGDTHHETRSDTHHEPLTPNSTGLPPPSQDRPADGASLPALALSLRASLDGPLPEDTLRSSMDDEPHSQELLWVPASVHPEVDAQQFQTHVKTTLGGLLERRLSRLKSVGRLRRSSLYFSTTDDELLGETQPSDGTGTVADSQHSQNIQTSQHNAAESADPRARNRLSNPSLSRLTSELQTMSRLAGMDSSDAVTLARSLSTSSLGYSDVERTAIDDLELASSFHADMITSPYADPGDHLQGDKMGAPQPRHPAAAGAARSHRGESPHRFSQHGNSAFGPTPGHGLPEGGSFSLRRTRRVGYRRGPAAVPPGSLRQSNKAGKLAQLRHKISTPSLQHSASQDLARDRSADQHVDSNLRASMQSINPRSSQVLFSYKVPVQQASSGHSKSVPSRPVLAQLTTAPLIGLSPKDSPYLSAMTSDALGRNLHPTKYAQHNLTSKSLGHQAAVTLPMQIDGSKSPRLGHRSSSREHEQKAQYKLVAGSPQPGPRKSHASHAGIRQASPTLSLAPVLSTRISSRESPVEAQGHWADQKGMMRNGSSVSLPAGSPTYQISPTTFGGETFETFNSRSISKRDKTRELNQNLDLLRNEINEFKESLATKIDPKKPKQEFPSTKDNKPRAEQTDFSFDLTHQDVSFEDSLAIEGDVLAELASSEELPRETAGVESVQNLTVFDEPKQDEIVSVPESADMKASPFRDAVTHETSLPVEISLLERQEKANDKSVEPQAGGDWETNISIVRNPHYDQSVEVVQLNDEPQSIDTNRSNGEIQTTEEISFGEGILYEEKRQSFEKFKQKASSESTSSQRNSQEKGLLKHENLHTKHLGSKQDNHHEPLIQNPNDLASLGEVTRQSTIESWQSSEKENKNASLDLSMKKTRASPKKKIKKNWPWSKEKTASLKIQKSASRDMHNPPVRSVSSPEILSSNKSLSAKEEISGKENAIAKFFKKRRSSSASHEKLSSDVHLTESADYPAREPLNQSDPKAGSKRNSRSSERRESAEDVSRVFGNKELKRENLDEDGKLTDDNRVTSRIKNRIKNMKKIHEEKEVKPEEPAIPEEENTEDDDKPKSTVEVQEKLKKYIKRYSRPNQPLEFTDSAFGFPLPPPSSSTLVMIDYRFPVHVERAIYRLSHLKLANPKRSLREQVILSNFMYAYLNLVDHTLHLEQQMTLEDCDMEQPEGDLDFLGDQDIDTEFEADDGFEESDFDSIKIDLDVKDTQISV